MNEREADLEYCPRDYKHYHCWERIGTDGNWIYYWCMQCKLCRREKIEFVKGGM